MKTGRYRHYKGQEYTVLGIARHSETEEQLVVYRQEYGARRLWVRPLAMFLETVEIEGRQVPRFELVAADINQIAPAKHIRLRDLAEDDLPTLYEFQLDAEANRLAATRPRNAQEFEVHWASALRDASIVVKAILVDDMLAGNIACFPSDGLDMVGYWIGREFWGQGVASRALELLLMEVSIRPLYARVATKNQASLRVLQKCGFAVRRVQHAPASDRYLACEEVILELA